MVLKGGDGFGLSYDNRFLFTTLCLVGQPVEVQVKNGSVYSGIFHTANHEKDYGVVLRMARLVRDGNSKGGKVSANEASRRPPLKIFVIEAKDLVQIIAKDVPITGNPVANGRFGENRHDLLTDTCISRGRHLEMERELKPWTPDEDAVNDVDLDSTFETPWNRNWDQFETNKTLFGVESTYHEELYTTKLQRGPQMKEREREALRIAREMEGKFSRKLNILEEHGVVEELDEDEESRFASVLRGGEEKSFIGDDNEDGVIDLSDEENSAASIYDSNNVLEYLDSSPGSSTVDEPDINSSLRYCIELTLVASKMSETLTYQATDLLLSINDDDVGRTDTYPLVRDETPISEPTTSVGENIANTHKGKLPYIQVGERSKHGGKLGEFPCKVSLISPVRLDMNHIQALDLDPGYSHVTEDVYREFNKFKEENAKRGRKQHGEHDNEQKPLRESLKDSTVSMPQIRKKDSEQRCVMPASKSLSNDVPSRCSPASSFSPSPSALPDPKVLAGAVVSEESVVFKPIQSTKCATSNPSSVPITSEPSNSQSVPSISSSLKAEVTLNYDHNSSAPRSSTGSLATSSSVKKSTLNPNAKEFKWNPNAKSFTPSRPPSPVFSAPVYVPGPTPPPVPLTHLQSMSLGMGVNSFGQQGSPLHFNPISATASSPFMQPPIAYTPGVSGAVIPPVLPGPAMKLPQMPQTVVGGSFGSQQPLPLTSPARPSPAFLYCPGQLYSQQMVYGPPGHVFYIQPFPQEVMQPPSMQASQVVVQSASQAQQQKYRGSMQQHHFMQPGQMPLLNPNMVNHLAFQSSQGVANPAGAITATLANSPLGGTNAGANFPQQ